MNITEKSLVKVSIMFCVIIFLQITCMGTGPPNLIANADIESGSPAEWSTWVNSGTNITQSWATDKSVSGSHSLKSVMHNDGIADWRQSSISIDINKRYRFKGQVYASNVAAGSHEIAIQWFNGPQYLSQTAISSNTADAWVEVNKFNIVPPKDATVAYVLLRTYKAGTYYFDDIIFKAEDKNLVEDANAESNSYITWNKWSSPGTNVTQTRATDKSVSWTHSLKSVMHNDGLADWRQHVVSGIDTSISYKFRAHIYASNIVAGSHEIAIQWFNGPQYLSQMAISSTTADVWEEVKSFDITPPANATDAYMLLRTYKAGIYYFDDIVFMREDNDLIEIDNAFPFGIMSLPNTQLLTNINMEILERSGNRFYKGTGHQPVGWSFKPEAGKASFEWDANRYSWGLHSLKIDTTVAGQSDWRQKVEKVEAGTDYILNVHIYASNVSLGSHSVEVHWFTASGSLLSTVKLSASTANQWDILSSGAITAPAEAAYAWILCRAYAVGTYNFDMVGFSKNLSAAERYADAYDAGFNFLHAYGQSGKIKSISADGNGLKSAYGFLPDSFDPKNSENLKNEVKDLSDSSSLAIWIAVDEAAWLGWNANDVAKACDIIGDNDDYFDTAPHYIFQLHAPRGTPAAPSDFSTLKPFSTYADIIGMDIYPVPEGNNHSSLSDQTISCVGKYVDILYDDVASNEGRQTQPIWMVLQGGFTWGLSNFILLHWVDENGVIRKDFYQIPVTESWQKISDSNITPPAGATHVYMLVRTLYNGTYYFDDIYLKENGTNLLENSNMEIPGLGWTTYTNGSGAPSQTWTTQTCVSPNRSLKTVMNGYGYCDWRQYIEIDTSKTYSLSAWINASTLNNPLPTWTELRFMVYNAIIHGARGVLFYEPSEVTIDSEAWKDMKKVAGEIKSLSDALTSNISFRKVTSSNSNVETLLMEYNGKLYLLAANSSNSSTGDVTYTISGLPLNSTSEFIENEQITISSNQFTDQFSGYQVHVYILD